MLALVLDDSRAMRSILTRTMTRFGFDVETAADGAEGLELVRRGPLPDVVLIDWNMPVMTGLEFVSQVRTTPAWRGITLMMVTAETDQCDIVRALTAGAHEYVTKPFTAEVIGDKLRLLGLV